MTTFIKSKFAKAAVGLLALAMVLVSVHSAKAVFTQNLAKGSTGAEVTALQVALNGAGFVVSASGVGSPGAEGTYFGGKTEMAVKAFQTAKGISAIGKVGPITRAALNALGGGSSSSFPAGCTSATGYSSTTGLPCNGSSQQQGSGPVSVSLASDNPAAGYLVAGQATADLAHFAFNGSGTVSSVTLQRTGLSTNTALSSVYLYDGAVRLTESASVNNVGVIVFNGVNLMVNGPKTISVKADIDSASNGQTVGVSLTGYTVMGSSMATANVAGNIMSISSGSGILGTANLCPSGCAPTSTVTVNAGLTQYILWTNPIQINTHAEWLKSLALHFIGSAPYDALANVGLFVDGTKIASSTGVNAAGYLVFDLSSAPKSLTTGSHTVDVRADIVKGSARTIQLTLQNAGDLMITDSQINVNVAPLVAGSAFSSVAGNTISVNVGSVTVSIDPSFTSLTNLTGGSTNSVIGKYKMHAYGEDVKVNTITILPVLSGMTPAAAGLNNLSLYFNGSQIGSSYNWTSGAHAFTLGSSLIIPAGVDSVLEVRADIQTSGNVNYTAGSIVSTLSLGVNNGQGMASLDSSIDVPAGSGVSTTGLTVQTGVISVSKNASYSSQTMNANTVNAKIASFVIQNQSTSEAVRVTNLGLEMNYTTITSTDLSNLKTSEASGSGSTPINPASSGVNNFSVEFTVAPGATKVLDVFADLGTASSGSVSVDLQLTALGASSNVTICAPGGSGTVDGCDSGTAKTGQLITLGTGTFNLPTAVTTSSTVAQNVAGGTTSGVTDATKATFKFTVANGNATITELGFTDSEANNALTQVRVGGVTAPVASNKAFLFGLSIPVPQGGTGANIDAFASYSPVGATGINLGGVTGSLTSNLKLRYVKYTVGGATTTECLATEGPGGSSCTGSLVFPVDSGRIMSLVASKPTVTVATPTSVVLAEGGNWVEALDVVVSADAAGPITLVSFPISSTLSASGGTGPLFDTTAIVVKDITNSTVVDSTGTTACTSSATCATTIVLGTGGYELTAGQSQTFRVYLPIATFGSPTGNIPNAYMYTKLVASSGFAWTDTAGGETVTTTDVTGKIYSYPSTFTSSIHN